MEVTSIPTTSGTLKMTTGLLFQYISSFLLLSIYFGHQLSTLSLRLEQTPYVLSLSSEDNSVVVNQTQSSSSSSQSGSVCKCPLLKYCYLLPGQCEECRKYFRENAIQLSCPCLTSKDCLDDEYCDWDKVCQPKEKTIQPILEKRFLLKPDVLSVHLKVPSADLTKVSCNSTEDCPYQWDLFCINGTCTEKKKDGEHCVFDDDCIDGRVCKHSICTKNAGYNEPCDTSIDCADNLFCGQGICIRKVPFGNNCQWNVECEAGTENSICELNTRTMRRQCKCWPGYRYIRNENVCEKGPIPGRDPKTALEIYKVTMIFASCCLALILLVFLGCVLRKSYCDNSQPQTQRMADDGLSSLFTIWNDSPHDFGGGGPVFGGATNPPFEKPPSYEETIRSMREEIGIPPPIYDPQTFTRPTAPTIPPVNTLEPMYDVNLDEPSTSREDTRSRFTPVSDDQSQAIVVTNSSHCDITATRNPSNLPSGQSSERLGHTNPAFVNEN